MSLLKVPRNSTNFTSNIFEFYKSLHWEPEWSFLKYYQNTIRAYCDHVDTGANGILAYLGMGMGKSILAASIAVDMLLNNETGFSGPGIKGHRRVNKCIFILTKSLAENMKGAIKKYFDLKVANGLDLGIHGTVDQFIESKFSFVSMNASNMIVQFIRAAAGRGLNGQLSAEDSVPGKIKLKDTLIIVDEAHNLFRGITNGSKNGLGFFKTMEESLKIRGHGNYMLFLTGTPINNNPFELVPCFNLLAGEEIMPTDYQEFREAFVSSDGSKKMKNESHFIDRIVGLVAYVTHESTPGKAIREDDTSTGIEFPEDLGIKVCLCPMSPDQFSLYMIARENESAEMTEQGRKGPVILKKMQLPKSSMTSSYRTKSRQLSNFYEDNLENKDPEKIKEPWTPKYDRLLGNVIMHNRDLGSLGLVYSQYVGIGGLGSLSVFLKKNGWKEYNLDYINPENDISEEVQEILEPTSFVGSGESRVQEIFGAIPENDAFNSLRKKDPYEYIPVNTKAYKSSIKKKNKERKDKDKERNGSFESNYDSEYDPDYDFYSDYKIGSQDQTRDVKDHEDEYEIANVAKEVAEVSTLDSILGDSLLDFLIIGGSKFYNEDNKSAPIKSSKTFAVIKGGLTPESRKRIEGVMTSPDNRHGEIVSLVLVSSVGAEGLDFKAIRHIHILEPYWNYARLAQIQFRGIRNDSHKSLPANEKNVQTYVYCAIPPIPGQDSLSDDERAKFSLDLMDFEKSFLKDPQEITNREMLNPGQSIPETTDTNLLFEAVKNYRVIESFLGPIQQSSLTAAIDAMPGARLCAPTDRPLYTNSIGADLRMPDSCKPYVTKKMMAKEIDFDDKKFYYVEDPKELVGFRIFNAEGKQIQRSSPDYLFLIDAIESKEGIGLL